MRDDALDGDELAIEEVYNLYYNAVVPATAPERTSIAIIFDAYAQVNQKLHKHDSARTTPLHSENRESGDQSITDHNAANRHDRNSGDLFCP